MGTGDPYWWGREMDAKGALRTAYMDPENITGYTDIYVQTTKRHPMQHLAQQLRRLGLERTRIGVEMDNYYFSAEAVTEGLEVGLAVAKPGNHAANIANALTQVLAKQGINSGDNRGGYSIGLSYPPDWGERSFSLKSSDTRKLQPGMAFHFMPGLWMDDWGLETTESVLITETGCKPLCTMERKLFIKD